MSYYLGIDGGGTKTTCAVGDESRVLATATTGPSNVVRVGEKQARASLQTAVQQACAAAGITPAQVSYTCVGGSGAAHPELAEVVRQSVAEVLSAPVDVVGDMQIALEAAFDEGPGVLVIAGTGSIAYGRDVQGATLRAGGWGFAVGDEGSAHWIGRMSVNTVLRAADPRPGSLGDAASRGGASESDVLPPNSLAAGLMLAWGVKSLSDLARAGNANPPPDFAALFPVVAATAGKLAEQVLTGAGRELANIAGVVIRGLFANDHRAPVPVAMTGGVFRHAALVRQFFYTELRRLDRRVEVNPNVVDPVEGALRMARRAAAKATPKRS